jgi:hypothetical protein
MNQPVGFHVNGTFIRRPSRGGTSGAMIDVDVSGETGADADVESGVARFTPPRRG